MAKHAIPRMPDGGRIINIASIAGHSAFEQSAAYCCREGRGDRAYQVARV
jgi:NAD(P)-dependent dehydrogenase (short-subunit alcohol dehydrogenase family)